MKSPLPLGFTFDCCIFGQPIGKRVKVLVRGYVLAFGSVGGTVLWNPRFDKPKSQECSTGHIGSDPSMGTHQK